MSQPPITPGHQPYHASSAPTGRQPSTSRALAFWTSGPGIIAMFAILGALLVGWLMLTELTADKADFEVSVVGCEFSAADATLPSAKVTLTVRNRGTQTRDATVQIEYRDGAGARVDTDTARVRAVRAGDTARAEETTVLDAAVTGEGRCSVTTVS